MNVDALPIPKVYNAVQPQHWRTICRVLGVALTVQFFLPWGPGMWFPMGFTEMWALIAGLGLGALGFAPLPPTFKRGMVISIMGAVGFIGFISAMAGGGLPIPPMTFFGFLGLIVTSFGLWHWVRNGYSQLAWIIIVSGLGCMVLSLLIPTMGELPLIFTFKVFGFAGLNIVARIFLFIIAAAYIAMAVFLVLTVVLKKEAADPAFVKLFAAATFLFIPFMYLLFMIVAGAMMLGAFHVLIIATSYVFLILYAGLQLVEAAQQGRIGEFFNS